MQPDGPPKAIIAFIHGFSDHCNAYYEMFPNLTSYGLEIRTLDKRGWGRSITTPASRGDTGPTGVVIADIQSFLSSIYRSSRPPDSDPASSSTPRPTPPVFLMGHSMGGGEVLYYMLKSSLLPPPSHTSSASASPPLPPIRGILAYSPLVALHPTSRPMALTTIIVKLGAKVLPHYQVVQHVEPSLMCRDKKVCEEWDNDPLCHDTMTLEGFAGMLDRGAWLDHLKPGAGRTDGEAPAVWVCHGTADQVNSCEASRRFVDGLAVRDKTLKAYEGGYHKLHVEPDGIKEALVKDVAEWVLARCSHPGTNDEGEGKRSKGKL